MAQQQLSKLDDLKEKINFPPAPEPVIEELPVGPEAAEALVPEENIIGPKPVDSTKEQPETDSTDVEVKQPQVPEPPVVEDKPKTTESTPNEDKDQNK